MKPHQPGCTVTADVEHAAVGETVTYTVKTTENYTIDANIKINGKDVALKKGDPDPETGLDTYTYAYTVLAADTTITAEASFNKREVKTVTVAAYTAIDASDPANASQQALEQSLPQTVAVDYDNGASMSQCYGPCKMGLSGILRAVLTPITASWPMAAQWRLQT